jgi:hypothetical protein
VTELECGGCVRPLPGLGRVVKSVVIICSTGELSLRGAQEYAAMRCGAPPGLVTAASHKVETRPPGTRTGFKQLPGLTFVVRQREEPVMQPPRFEGEQAEAERLGWREEAYGWVCPACAAEASTHAPGEDDAAGLAGLDEFFATVKK